MTRLQAQRLRYVEPRARTYRLSDGNGLALQVMPNGTKAWRSRYRIARREKVISLGLYPAAPIEAARRLRGEARAQATRGSNVQRWLVKLETDVRRGKLAAATLKRTRWLLTKYFVPTRGAFIRPIELVTAEWEHIDLGAAEWRIPAESRSFAKPTSSHAAALRVPCRARFESPDPDCAALTRDQTAPHPISSRRRHDEP